MHQSNSISTSPMRPFLRPEQPRDGRTPELRMLSLLARMKPDAKLELARLVLIAYLVNHDQDELELADDEFTIRVERRQSGRSRDNGDS